MIAWLILFVMAGPFVGGLLYAFRRKDRLLEQVLLLMAWLLLGVGVVAGWGDYGNVHGGAIWLLLLGMAAITIVLAQAILLVLDFGRYRAMQTTLVAVAFAMLIVAAAAYG